MNRVVMVKMILLPQGFLRVQTLYMVFKHTLDLWQLVYSGEIVEIRLLWTNSNKDKLSLNNWTIFQIFFVFVVAVVLKKATDGGESPIL